ncbi:hypothetical protein C0581_03150 [Candidatus Parcubacteria bacterium]|nr:MAG: hypothetical protein C0581_03150 [Candidatus Parcubacteria bacterium]
MHISWLGTTAIKLQTKPLDKDIVIVIDPYKPASGSFPRSLTPEIGLYTRGEKNSITLSANPYTLSTPGEIDTKGVLVTAAEGHEAGTTMVRIDVEGVSLGHLGLTNKPLTAKQLEVLAGIDILCIPVGHPDSYDAEAAVKAVNTIEPRVVIPMAFKSDNDKTAKPVDSFLKEIGSKNGDVEKKVIIKKRDLPQEETEVIVLEKE